MRNNLSISAAALVAGNARMAGMLNPFANDAWEQTALTDAINRLPYVPLTVSERLGWVEEGVTQKTVLIDIKDGGFDIVDDADYNGVPQEFTVEDGEPIPLVIKSHPARSVVRPEEVSGRRAFGSEFDTETVEERKNHHLEKLNTAQEFGKEVDRIGALQGKILRRDGSVKTDLGAAFGKTNLMLEFDFEDDEADIQDFFMEAKDALEEQALDVAISSWHVFAPTPMFRAAVKNKKLKEKWLYHNQHRQSDDKRAGFEIVDGVVLEQYSPNLTIPNSGGRKAFPLTKMLMCPIAAGFYQTRYAPRQDLNYVNTVGLPAYVRSKILDGDEGLQLDCESNHIHYARRLEAIGDIQQWTP